MSSGRKYYEDGESGTEDQPGAGYIAQTLTAETGNDIVYFENLCKKGDEKGMDDGGPTASFIVFFLLLLIDVLFYGFGEAGKGIKCKEDPGPFEEI